MLLSVNINLNQNSSKMSQNQPILAIFDFIESLDNNGAFVHLIANYNLQNIEKQIVSQTI